MSLYTLYTTVYSHANFIHPMSSVPCPMSILCCSAFPLLGCAHCAHPCRYGGQTFPLDTVSQGTFLNSRILFALYLTSSVTIKQLIAITSTRRNQQLTCTFVQVYLLTYAQFPDVVIIQICSNFYHSDVHVQYACNGSGINT